MGAIQDPAKQAQEGVRKIFLEKESPKFSIRTTTGEMGMRMEKSKSRLRRNKSKHTQITGARVMA